MGHPRWVILAAVLTLSLVAPAALCLGVARAPAGSMADLLAAGLAAGAWMALLALVNWWEFTSIRLRWVWPSLLAAVIAGRAFAVSKVGFAAGPTSALGLALAALAVWPLTTALRARHHDGRSIDLVFPLRGGRFLVTDGGDGARSFLVNYHYGFGRHRASGVNRSMRYAMDVVEIGGAGGEARGLLPAQNAAYLIWQRTLEAPCDGRVAHVVNDIADNAAFGRDRPYGVGNHVVIRADADVYVVLGHMLRGSVLVSPGDSVRAGQAIGRVGNSGWTERPHLHMQAMRSGDGDWWHGEGVAMHFGGRFLVRNQVIRT